MSKPKHHASVRTLSCSCEPEPRLIFACSGTSAAGELAERAAKELTRIGVGRMYCLAGISARQAGITQSTKNAEKILVIDGCPLDCAAGTLRQAGFRQFDHLRLCDMAADAEPAVACDVNIERVVEKGRALLEGWMAGTSADA